MGLAHTSKMDEQIWNDDIFENYLFRHTYVDRPDRGVCKTLAVAEAKVVVEESTRTTSLIMNWSQIVTSCIKLNPVV